MSSGVTRPARRRTIARLTTASSSGLGRIGRQDPLTRRSECKTGAVNQKGLAALTANPLSLRWLRGLDLNQRPLGYERLRGRAGSPLILREKRNGLCSSTLADDT